MTDNSPTEIDFGSSILFLGSGFSTLAKNIMGDYMPAGNGLRNKLADLLGIDHNNHDLKTISDEYFSRGELNLYQTLYEIFTTREVDAIQSDIISKRWLRIYTTNYDDVVEYTLKKSRINHNSFSYDDPKPRKVANGSVVHLHGSILKANEENILDQLILNESSYVRQHFEKSPWYDDFIRDIRFCQSFFFAGYSLADYHISSLLMQNPAVKQKTFFITRGNDDSIFQNRVRPYGSVLPIGFNGFQDLLNKLPKVELKKGDISSLKALKYIDPFKDNKSLASPTFNEISSLITFGKFVYQRCLSTLPNSDYVIPRSMTVKEAAKSLSDNRTLLVHSRLGNGKTIFLYILAHHLTELGYKCFLCGGSSPLLARELKIIDEIPNVIIMFDDYDASLDAIETAGNSNNGFKFVVNIRTGVQEVRLHEVYSRMPPPVGRLSLNELSNVDTSDFEYLLDKAGIRPTKYNNEISKCRDIREIVVAIYNNAEIKEKIEKEIRNLTLDRGTKQLVVSSHLLTWLGHHPSVAFLKAVTGRDAYVEFRNNKEIAIELYKFDNDEMEVRSAILSEYIVKHYFDSQDIIDSCFMIIIEAVKRKKIRHYRSIMSSLMQVSNLKKH